MSRQDKATTDRNAKILRALVKAPDNKVCADCRRNDARWAAWNLGVFVCIRCSGIHRSMGTHISKVKSVDLDIWQPDQMEQIQKWGNKLGNLYWEAHLKPGHVPPEHKIDSFIRSKYESRRWALNGPMPSDPRVLLSSAGAAPDSPPSPPVAQEPRTSASHAASKAAPAHPLLSRTVPSTQAKSLITPAASPAPPAPAPAPAQAPPAPSSSLFDLDFQAPPPSSSAVNNAGSQRGNNKNDIMSLFSAPPPAQAHPPALTSASNDIWGGNNSSAGPRSNAFGDMSLGGSGGEGGGWGVPVQAPVSSSTSGSGSGGDIWGSSTSVAAAPPSSINLWSTPTPTAPDPSAASSNALWDAQPATTNAWATPSAPPAASGNMMSSDAFADIWK